jgi:hypothetical protein
VNGVGEGIGVFMETTNPSGLSGVVLGVTVRYGCRIFAIGVPLELCGAHPQKINKQTSTVFRMEMIIPDGSYYHSHPWLKVVDAECFPRREDPAQRGVAQICE